MSYKINYQTRTTFGRVMTVNPDHERHGSIFDRPNDATWVAKVKQTPRDQGDQG